MRSNNKNLNQKELSENQEDEEELSDDEPKEQNDKVASPHLDCDNSPKIIPVAKLPERLKKKNIIINISDTQYPIVEEVAEELGWEVQTSQGIGDWDVWWTDRQINADTLYRMNLHQKINHFPGISELARKNLLALNLSSMQQKFPNQYNFFPQTWSIPLQFPQFRKHFIQKQSDTAPVTYIVKPQALSQGRGIFLTRNINDILNGQKYVIQKYVDNPMLIEGLKFDLRLYVLVKSIEPLKIYIYEQGLVRLATQKYQKVTQQNMRKVFMHLTNYSLNKRNPLYQKNQIRKEQKKKEQSIIENESDVIQNSNEENIDKIDRGAKNEDDDDSDQSVLSLDTQQLEQIEIGHKRSLESFWDHLSKEGFSAEEKVRLKERIHDLIVKTVISGSPALLHQYKYCQPQSPEETNMCFHILGFDVMITETLEPMIIEINHTPSFETNSELDYRIKKNLILDTLKLMNITQKNKKKLFKKGKQINKRRLQTGKREIVPDKKGTNDAFGGEQILGGFTQIHPVILDESSKDFERNKALDKKYRIFLERASIVHKETAETRRKLIKQEQEKVKVKNQINKDKQKILEKKKTELLHPHSENKDEHKHSTSNLQANSLSAHQNKDATAKHNNNFRMKTNKKPSYLISNNVAPQLTEQGISAEYATPSPDIRQKINSSHKKTRIGVQSNPHSAWNDREKQTQLIRFSQIMMKLVVTKEQTPSPLGFLGGSSGQINELSLRSNKLIISHKEAKCKIPTRQQKEQKNGSAKKVSGNFIVPRTYQIVDGRNSKKQINGNKNSGKGKEFTDLLSSIEQKHKQPIDAPILNTNCYKINNKLLYKKKKRYSVI